MNKRGRSFKITVFVILAILFVAIPFVAHSQTKDKIRFGTAIGLSGPYAPGAKMTQTTVYDLWVSDVNAKGGIYLKSLNKRLPVELITYDDKSDVGTTVKLAEKLILEDKVDMLLAPWGTAANMAVAPITHKYKYPFILISCSSEKLREVIHTLPNCVAILNQPRDQAGDLIELLKEFNLQKVAIIYVADLHGIEFAGFTAPKLGVAGIDVAILKSYPLGSKDLMPILKQIKAADVDALIGFSYPPDTHLITEQAKVLQLNPKAVYLSVGVAHPPYKYKFGAETIEGVMGPGAWSLKSPYPGIKEFVESYKKRYNSDPDWWGGIITYSALQIHQQAIEKVGAIDHKKIGKVFTTETFPTMMGPVRFVDGFNIQFPGNIGQWQKGMFEVIMPKDKRTANPIFPKPPWPQ
jgi:branched-chain amino acid transport system substrate-binding protein